MDLLWNKTRLRHFLLLDNWNRDQALDILSGFDPNAPYLPPDVSIVIEEEMLHEIPTLFEWPTFKNDELDENFEWHKIHDYFIYENFINARNFREDLKDIWEASDYGDEDRTEEQIAALKMRGAPVLLRRSPKLYIDYFVAKNYKPKWLSWAIEEDLYIPEAVEKTNQKNMDNSTTHYPEEVEVILELVNDPELINLFEEINKDETHLESYPKDEVVKERNNNNKKNLILKIEEELKKRKYKNLDDSAKERVRKVLVKSKGGRKPNI